MAFSLLLFSWVPARTIVTDHFVKHPHSLKERVIEITFLVTLCTWSMRRWKAKIVARFGQIWRLSQNLFIIESANSNWESNEASICKVLGSMSCQIQAPSFPVSQSPSLQVCQSASFPVAQSPRFPGSQFPRLPGFQAPGLPGSQAPRLLGSQAPRLPGS